VLPALDYFPVFESRARAIRSRFESEGTLAGVYQEIRGAKIELPVRTPEQIRARLAAALESSSVGRLAESLFGSAAAKRWPELLSGLDAAARRPDAGASAFRVPLADGPAPLHQLQLWAVRLARASPTGTAPSGVLYRSGGDVPCGVFFFRDAKAEDILLFHPGAVPTGFVEEVPARPPAPPIEEPPPEAQPAGWDLPLASLLDPG
jgi:hypothetical protein